MLFKITKNLSTLHMPSVRVYTMGVVGLLTLVSRAVQHQRHQQQLFLSLFLISLTALHTHTHNYIHTHTKRVKIDFLGISRRTSIPLSTLLAFSIHWSLFDKYFQSAVLIKNAEHNSAQECVPLRRQAKAN